MPRLSGVRERRHQPFYDTLIRTTGVPGTAILNNTALFGNSNIGNLAMTNMQTAGQLASDQTYVALALRAFCYFDGTNRRANYLNTAVQLYFTLQVGEKPMFTAPTWYKPAGGGIWGFDSTTSIFNNGTPDQQAFLKLARPIVIPVRQNFQVNAQWFAVGATVGLDLINAGAEDDQKLIMYLVDGLQTRDVQ
jgi:hypothetical protein